MMNHDTDQALYYVPKSLNKALDLLPMLQAVSTGLDLLQPWISTDRSNFPAKVEPFVDKVREQSGKYHEALALSAQVAQNGFNWTLDMERYCTVLKRGSGSNELLNGYVKLMRAGAKDAQRQAKELSGRFLCVSAALRQVAADAEKEAESSAKTITSSAAQIQENTQKWEKAKKTTKTISNVSDALTGTMLVGAAFLGAPVFLATAAGAAIGYGVGHLVGEIDERLNDNKMSLAVAKQIGFKAENSPYASAVLAKNALTELEVIRYLTAVVGGIELIVKHVDVVAKWWGDMDSELEGIEATGLARLDGQNLASSSNRNQNSRRHGRRLRRADPDTSADGGNAMNAALIQDAIALVQDSIKQRKEDFKEYKNQVHALQAKNPPPRLY